MMQMVWEKMTDGVMTPATDPVWICPICHRGLHTCKDNNSDGKDKCPDCGMAMKYPWEK